MSQPLRIGCGAGTANDRFDAAVELVENGSLDVLVLECLAERTTALGQLRERTTPGSGADPTLARRVRSLLEPLRRHRTRLITNLGSANPMAGGQLMVQLATELGMPLRVAVLSGDDVSAGFDQAAPAWEDGRPLDSHGELISANAYLGAEHILPALQTGADVVITGRVADPSLFVAPIAEHYGWRLDDWQRMADGTVVGHLLECGSQVSGGYFADPPYKVVPDLAHLGFPVALVREDGRAVVTKNPETGGLVTVDTVLEQLTYEVLDPTSYLTPDVTADFHAVSVNQVGPDQVAVHGATGRPRPEQLKVSVGYKAGYRCEAEISYAGAGSVARGRLAADVVRERVSEFCKRARVDLFGVNALHGEVLSRVGDPYECRVRLSVICPSLDQAEAAADEVVGLNNNGPAGGGGARSQVTEVVGILSTTIDRTAVNPAVTMLVTQ